MDARAEIKPASVTESGLKVGTCEHLNSERSRLKREMFYRIRGWLRNGTSDFEARRIRAEGDAARKGTRSTSSTTLRRDDHFEGGSHV